MLLDGGFDASAIAAYNNYSYSLIAKVKRLKKEGKSLSPKKSTRRPRKIRD